MYTLSEWKFSYAGFDMKCYLFSWLVRYGDFFYNINFFNIIYGWILLLM